MNRGFIRFALLYNVFIDILVKMDWRRWASIARLSIRKMCCLNGSRKLHFVQKILRVVKRLEIEPCYTLLVTGGIFCAFAQFFAGIGPAHFLAETTRPLGRGCLHFHLLLYPLLVCQMAMGTKNAATLIGELRLVAPPRLELSQTEPKSGVLPLHHGAIDFNFAILRAQRYGIILTFPNFSGKIFRICTQFVGKCYVCCSKSLGSPYASMTLMT